MVLLHKHTLTHRRFDTQKPLHTNTFTHRRFYTQTQRFYTQTLVHTDEFYTQKLLHTDGFTHRRFYTQMRFTHAHTLSHTNAFTHRRVATRTLLHTDAFARRWFLHTHTYTRPWVMLRILWVAHGMMGSVLKSFLNWNRIFLPHTAPWAFSAWDLFARRCMHEKINIKVDEEKVPTWTHKNCLGSSVSLRLRCWNQKMHWVWQAWVCMYHL